MGLQSFDHRIGLHAYWNRERVPTKFLTIFLNEFQQYDMPKANYDVVISFLKIMDKWKAIPWDKEDEAYSKRMGPFNAAMSSFDKSWRRFFEQVQLRPMAPSPPGKGTWPHGPWYAEVKYARAGRI